METKVHRVRLSFDVVGPQGANDQRKPPIILLHALTSSKETWKNVMHPIAKATGRKVYAFDARNHGNSGWSDEMSYEVMQEDLLQFVDDLHIEKAVLVGHSMGGKTAMLFAAKWPERVEKLIVEDVSPKPVFDHLRIELKKYVQMLMKITDRIPDGITKLEDAKNFVCKLLQENTPEAQRSSRHSATDGSNLPLIQDENGRYRWKTNMRVIADTTLSESYSPPPVRGTYHGPTLFLHGTKSPYKVTNDRGYILSHFPGARFRAVEGAAHQIHLEYGEVFVSEVEHFLNESRL